MSFLYVYIAGCATAPSVPIRTIAPALGKGVYHKVRKGETIWRIAQAYRVSIDDIIKINKIPNVANVEQNQLLFIPGADSVKEILLTQEDLNKSEFAWPLKGKVISYFGERRGLESNKGIGIQANLGENVRASREGRVVFADHLSGYGYTVIIDHQDGYYSVYANNAALLAKVGDFVLKGAPIAQVGKRENLTALHFEIRKHSLADNPLYYLP
ncbi:MAG: hypothetical protein A3D10_07960 [Omnitrophica WOR_2 bacterium RIFCSPHIGHO2_02_FULL_48_11]|nr:MAG: hypothetical protein A3D10_07960 [Omnitrophica WOR_2 bacterium RIFCSPHIGHO2_02_FULL_48_11]